MLQSWRAVFTRFRAMLRSDAAGVRAGFYALLLSSGGDLIAGLTLGSITGTLAALPGLLVLVPAAIGMRGNVFGALGSRLGTAVHTGTFRMSARRDTLVGQNLAASISMSLSVSLVLAVLAKAISVAFGLENTISLVDFVVISVIGGFLSSIVVMGITVVVAQQGVRHNWDLDNVSAPIVTAAGDMVTLPALFLATYLVGIPWLTVIVAVLCAIAALIALGRQPAVAISRSSDGSRASRCRCWCSPAPSMSWPASPSRSASSPSWCTRRCWCSCPRSWRTPARWAASSALACRPSSISARSFRAGAACARSARTSSSCTSTPFPSSCSSACPPTSPRSWRGSKSPGSLEMIAVSMLAGVIATTFAVLVGFYGAVAAYRLGLDPDNHGIPIVTSSLDLLGAFALILVIVALGLS